MNTKNPENINIAVFSDLHEEFDNKKIYVFKCSFCHQNFSMVFKKNKYNNAKCVCEKSYVKFKNKSDQYFSYGATVSDCYKDNGYPEYLKSNNTDIIIANGDISYGILGVMALMKYSPIPVFYVPGNHEFYTDCTTETRTSILNDMRSIAKGSNVIVMDRDFYDFNINNQTIRILGATLWTDYRFSSMYQKNFDSLQLENMTTSKKIMNDYKYIYGKPGDNITPEELLNENLLSVEWFHKEFKKANEENLPTIMVTHHPSLPIGLGNQKDKNLAPFYVNDLSEKITILPVYLLQGVTQMNLKTK